MFDATMADIAHAPLPHRTALRVDYGFHATPFGTALAAVHEQKLCLLVFTDEENEQHLAERRALWSSSIWEHDPALSSAYVQDVFAPSPRPVPLLLIGTEFQIGVWKALLKLRLSELTSYGALAERIGKPQAARAVGGALGRNPIAVAVPCHRIISRDGALTGYHWGLERKRALLAWEASYGEASHQPH
jgi:AraC family transcriptional regulator, regulatory protein of adaptative response / methylated-DNA-[protein]-cysteine methyltransferase